MTLPAFKAAFADMKLVKTRQVAQLIFEIPLAEFDAAYDVLGGLPNPASERWFAVAAIKLPQAEKETKANPQASPPATPRSVPDKPQAGAKREWRDLSPPQQAGIRCEEPVFAAFLKENHPDDWRETDNAADCVRLICGVESRSQLIGGTQHTLWRQLDDEFLAWRELERAS